MTKGILHLDELKVWFGGVRAVDGVTLSLEEGRLYGMVGPNGSGKTTLVNAISGLAPVTAGTIRFLGADLVSTGPHEVSRAGVARTFQGVRLLPTLTVRENILLAADRLLRPAGDEPCRTKKWITTLHWGRAQRRLADAATDDVLDRLNLGAVARRYPNTLPYGTQRRVEIARALVGAPKLLLLDEPIAGMNQEERAEIAALVKQLSVEGLTELIIEHDLRTMLEICDHLFVMNFGRCVAAGSPHETAMRPEVQEAYLGKSHVVA